MPKLKWIYVHRRTMEVRYGSREEAKGHLLGPFGWTAGGQGEESGEEGDDECCGLTIEHWEGFVAVEERSGLWALYYDRGDDGLRDVVTRTRVLQCSLERKVVEHVGQAWERF